MDQDTQYQNRIVEMRTMRAGELSQFDGNPFFHPAYQSQALEGSLEEIGIVDTLKAYYSERNGGSLTLLDGHDRQARNPDQVWPVVILDIDDEEADKQMAMHNTIARWNEIDPLKMQKVVDRARFENKKAKAARDRLIASIQNQIDIAKRAKGDEDAAPASGEMVDRITRSRAVKVVLNLGGYGSELATVEKALRLAGKDVGKRRGAALTAVCQYYLDNHAE